MNLTFWTGFAFGTFAGVAVGLLTAGLCAMASKRDEWMPRRGPLLRYDRYDREVGEKLRRAAKENDEAWVAGVGVRRRGEGW